MQSFLSVGKTIYTVAKEKSKFEMNGTQESSFHSPRSALRGLLEGLLLFLLHIRRGKIIKEVGNIIPQIYISYYNTKVVKRKIHINSFSSSP